MRTVSGRSTVVREVSSENANRFMESNHRQGAVVDGLKSVNLGLYLEDELLAVIQFCAPRTSGMKARYTVELLRLAFLQGVRVQGGASKLIKAYIKLYNPSDFFTYQDTSGESTAVYEHAGMKLVSRAGKKQYLVAPGKTLETGSRKEVLGMPYATRFGPDRIVGSKLGEVFREDGTRKSNKELFLEELGWHIEETSGDRIYEWINPEAHFYLYKTTATDSEKYYYGVKRINGASITEEDCLTDGYFGSGGKNPNNKFRNWLKAHKFTVQKEILSIHDRRNVAFKEENRLIGDLWRDDPLCLNSRAGGAVSPPSSLEAKTYNNCEIHGEVGFLGGKCRSCILKTLETIETCAEHGETSFFAGQCRSCMSRASLSREICDVHGEEVFRGGRCQRCFMQKALSLRKCPEHGESIHMGSSCALCTSAKVFSIKNCPEHGETKFVGDRCSKCMHGKAFYTAICATHGETKHKGGKCYRCQTSKGWGKGDCVIHGKQVTFHGSTCLKCRRIAEAERRVATVS